MPPNDYVPLLLLRVVYISLLPIVEQPPSNNTIRVMLEDFDVSGGVAGDIFFDNIRLQVIPEPTSLTLLSIGAVGLFGYPAVRLWKSRWRKSTRENEKPE